MTAQVSVDDTTMRGRIRTRGPSQPWADVFIEARPARLVNADPIGCSLPEPGLHVDGCRHDGVVRVDVSGEGDASDAADLTVSLHPYLNDETDTGYVLTLVTYPDGFRVAFSTGYYASRIGLSAEGLWHMHTCDATDLFARAFITEPDSGPTPLHEHLRFFEPTEVSPGLCVAANALRVVAEDPDGFWVGRIPPYGPQITPPADSLVTLVSNGLTSYRVAQSLSDNGVLPSDFIPAVCAGFDVEDPTDYAWVEEAVTREWAHCHANRWTDLYALKQDGWSLAAARVLHPPEVLQADAGEDESAWRANVGVDLLEVLLGSAAAASLYLEAGFTLNEAETLYTEDRLPTAEMLAGLVALRGVAP